MNISMASRNYNMLQDFISLVADYQFQFNFIQSGFHISHVTAIVLFVIIP
jgi:hypothetical protein